MPEQLVKTMRNVLAVLAALFLASCAAQPAVTKPVQGDVSLSLRPASAKELPSAGGGLHTPYAPPDLLITKSDQDFVVLALELETAREENLTLVEFASDSGILRPYTRSELVDWWKDRSIYDGRKTSWIKCLERTYVPSGEFRMKPGRSTYFVVLMGKKPITKPQVVRARYFVDSEERELVCRLE